MRLGNAIEKGALLLGMLAAASGCWPRHPATIAVITPTVGLEYWEDFARIVRSRALAAGIHADLAAPQSVSDCTGRARMVESALARHVQEIIVAPSHQLRLSRSDS